MPVGKIFQRKNPNKSLITRERIKTILLNKYYNLYLDNYEIEGDIGYQAKEYVLKRFWADGKIASFKMKELDSPLIPKGESVFYAPFAPTNWNIYDYPVGASIINTRGVKFFPKGVQIIDKDIVIGYAQKNRKSIYTIVEYYVDRMTDVLMVINTNLKTCKMPWLVGGTPESHNKIKTLFDKLDNDDPELYIDSDDIDKFKALVSGAPYIIDKLYNYYCAIEDELREFLGFQNLGVGEKKEHLITSEISANNSLVEANQDSLFENLKAFFERVSDLFGVNITIKLRHEIEEESFTEEENFEEEGDKDNE